MGISFYEQSVATYLRILDNVADELKKGVDFAKENNLELSDFVHARLFDDMAALHFQVVTVCLHSWGALQGMRDGTFAPPPSFGSDKSYAELQALVDEARNGVASFSEADANKLPEKSLIFVAGGREMHYTNQKFLAIYSLPNLYFHAVTTHSILRMLGVPLRKREFLGEEVRRIWDMSETNEI